MDNKGGVGNKTFEHLARENAIIIFQDGLPWWLKIRLPMQGTQVRSLVWEDHTCLGATKPVRHNY